MSFPLTPTNGQTTSLNGITYVYSSTNNSWTRLAGFLSTTSNLTITSTATVNNTVTGALQVAGGVGIGGNVFVGGTVTATTFSGNLSGTATTATNIAGGATGSIPIQSAVGTTAYIPLGTSGYVLTAGSNTATWTAISGLSAGLATTATNLAGGTAGQVPYQSNVGSTAFTGPGTAGQLLVSNGTSGPSFTNQVATLIVTSTQSSTSSYSANALYVAGGIGGNKGFNINGDGYLTGNLYVTGIITGTNVSLNTLVANSGTFYGDATGGGALYAGITNFTPFSQTMFQASGNLNNYMEINVQNINPGAKASTDIVASADNVTVSSAYIDMGIASSTFDSTQLYSLGQTVGPNDGYLMVGQNATAGLGDLIFGTLTSGTQMRFVLANGTTSTVTNAAIAVVMNTPNTPATSTSTGTLVVFGGVGISGNAYIGGNVTATNFYGNVFATNTATIMVGLATTATYAQSFNTATLVANAVTAFTATWATTATYAQSFNTATLVANAVTASTATNAATAYSTVGTLSTGTGILGSSFNGSTNVTLTLNTATLMALAVTATYAQSFNTSTLVANAVNAYTATWATTATYALAFNTATLVANAVTASTATNAATAYSTIGTLSTGTGILGSSFNGSTNVTLTLNTATLMALAVTANNISGGATGSIPIQSAAGTTAYIPLGNAGYVLTAGATTATWTAVSGLSAGTATNANNILTAAQPANTTYYPTFVSANNATAAYQSEYTTSSFSINAATGNISIGGTVTGAVNGTGGTAFLAGNGAYNNIALGMQASSGPANMAIRDLSTVSSVMYFDSSVNATQGGQFSFRATSSFTELIKLTTASNTINVPTSITSTALSTTTTTGALVVSGGIGLGGNIITAGYGQFAGAFNESTTQPGVFIGISGSGTPSPRAGFFNGNTAQNWEIDNYSGAFRWFTPGVTRMQLDTSGNLTVYSTSATNSTSSGALVVSGGVGIGGGLNVGGTAYIAGDLYVDGTQFIVNKNVISSGDSAIILSTGSTTALLAINSGLYIGATSSTAYASFYFDGVANWVVGGTAATGLKSANYFATSYSSVGSYTSTQKGEIFSVNGGVYVNGIVTATTVIANVTGNVTGNLTGTATTATNIANGATGSIPIQSAAGTTAFIPLGATGYVLTAGATTATWTAVSGLSAGTATNANNVLTVAQTGNASYYPVFVSSNNATAGYQSEYTTSSFYINAATGAINVGGSLQVAGGNPGGVYIGTHGQIFDDGNFHIHAVGDGNLWINNASTSSNTDVRINNQSTGSVILTNGVGNVRIVSTQSSNSATSGALQVTGGVGIGGGVFVGGVITATSVYANIYASNTATIMVGLATTATYAQTFNTATLVANAVTAFTATWATTATYAQAFNTATLVASAVTANNISGGAQGSIPIQSAAGTTAYIPLGNAGYVLTAGATTATWSAVSGLSAGTATNANNILTAAQGANATYYPTFVSANNATAAYQSEYTTSSFNINPNSGLVSITGALNVVGGITSTNHIITGTTSVSSTNTGALQVAGGAGIAGGLFVGATITSTNIVISGITAATTTNTGALIVAGGVGVGGGIVAGGVVTATTFGSSGALNFNINSTTLGAAIDTNGNFLLGGITSPIAAVTGGSVLQIGSAASQLGSANNPYAFANGKYSTTAGVPQYTGNWASGNWWAFGPDTNAADTTLRLGVATVGTSGFAWQGAYANLKLNNLSAASINVTGVVTATTFYGTFIGTLSTIVSTASTVVTLATTNNALYYPTFVNTLNTSTTAGQTEYTTSSFTINPSTGIVNINSVSAASSTNTGALQVAGGVGIGGSIYAGGTINSAGAANLGTGSGGDNLLVGLAGARVIINGGGGGNSIRAESSNGTLSIYGGGQQTIGLTVSAAGVVTINTTTNANSTTTGALVVTGGIGIGGGGYFGGVVTATNFYVNGYAVSTSTGGGSVSVQATATNASYYPVFVSVNTATATALPEYSTSSFSINPSTGAVTIGGTAASTSTTTGALTVAGGVGVGGALYAGSVYAGGTQLLPNSIQTFTAAANTTTFSISGGYVVGQIQVFVNGISLSSVAGDFTASNGSTVVLATPRNAGDVVQVISQQTFNPSGQQAYIFNQYTSNGTTTTFATNYNTATVQVYQNGVLQYPTTYTANNGTSIVFSSIPSNGTVIGVISFNSVSIANAISSSGGTIQGNLNVAGSLQQNGQDITAFATAMAVAMGI